MFFKWLLKLFIEFEEHKIQMVKNMFHSNLKPHLNLKPNSHVSSGVVRTVMCHQIAWIELLVPNYTISNAFPVGVRFD